LQIAQTVHIHVCVRVCVQAMCRPSLHTTMRKLPRPEREKERLVPCQSFTATCGIKGGGRFPCLISFVPRLHKRQHARTLRTQALPGFRDGRAGERRRIGGGLGIAFGGGRGIAGGQEFRGSRCGVCTLAFVRDSASVCRASSVRPDIGSAAPLATEIFPSIFIDDNAL
jgi:hypothetical protein